MNLINKYFNERNYIYSKIFNDTMFENESMCLYSTIYKIITNGGKLLLCGNGGSAADCQHIAGEFIGRLTKERTALPAIALCSDTSILTCIGNDYTFERLFERQIEALGNEKDLLIALSTSGNSKNIVNAIKIANKNNIPSFLITNNDGGVCFELATKTLRIPSQNTQIVQEITMVLFHSICEMLENELF